MAEMRTCKECGKLFIPKGRERYCSDVHYRPCPICGTPVEAKYLSDPPRKCNNCRGKRSAPKPQSKPSKMFKFDDAKFSFGEDKFKFAPQPKTEEKAEPTREIPKPTSPIIKTSDIITEIPETVNEGLFCKETTGTVRRYIGPEIKNGFIPGHDYELIVDHSGQCYGVKSELDVTDHAEVNIFLHYTSQISINQNFARIKEVGGAT